MKLLTPQLGMSRRDVENSAQELRSVQLDGVIMSKRKEINELDVMMVRSLSETGKKNYEEEQKWREKIRILTEEVEQLEKRKERAVAPLTEQIQKIETAEQKLIQREHSTALKESGLQNESMELIGRLSDVIKREEWAETHKKELDRKTVELSNTEQEIIKKKATAEADYENFVEKEMEIRESIAKLNVEIATLREERRVILAPVEVQERLLREKETILNGKEISLSTKEKQLEAERKDVSERLNALEREEDALEAQKTALQALESEVLTKQAEFVLKAQKEAWTVEKTYAKLRIEQEKRQDEAEELRQKIAEFNKLRDRTLVPLEKREEEVDTKEDALLKREEMVLIKETDNSQTAELLHKRLDEISEREQKALEHSVNLEARSSNLSIKEEDTQKRQDALLFLMKQWNEDKLSSEAQIANREAVLKGRDTVLNERERNVDKKEKGFANREKSILDKYQTLQRAVTEMKLKYGDKLNIKL